MRVRYEEKYVPEQFKSNPKDLVGKEGAFVFAEGAKKNQKLLETPTGEELDYRFLPIRRCTVRQAQNLAGIVILDLELGEFFDYGAASETTWASTWDRTIKEHKNRPYLKAPKDADPATVKHGLYVYEDANLAGEANPRKGERAWRSVISSRTRTARFSGTACTLMRQSTSTLLTTRARSTGGSRLKQVFFGVSAQSSYIRSFQSGEPSLISTWAIALRRN
jgi:hypothetical protein